MTPSARPRWCCLSRSWPAPSRAQLVGRPLDEATVLARTDSRAEGLNEDEIAPREIRYGPNQIARTKRRSKPRLLLDNVRNPLIILLLVLSVVSYLTGDLRAAVVVLVMVVLGVVLRFVQEMRCRVMGAGRGAARMVDFEGHLVADFEAALLEHA